MKRLIIIGILASITNLSFAQEKPKLVEYYMRHDQIGSRFTRWYWHLRNVPTTAWMETLALTDNGRFVHYMASSSLPSWVYGTWQKENNVIRLQADSVYSSSLKKGAIYEFVVVKRKLYNQPDQLNSKRWVMKRVH
ncbi:hypothetical protein ACFQ21_02695 [Ohtaekwangia kribbensis]|uniref:Uncharacterized protein n=1 Tax=Ohtaekwangia kribbensis TaxID=688913 RepID=A0ABW3JZ28_9BACT